jgi:hypothetical protein
MLPSAKGSAQMARSSGVTGAHDGSTGAHDAKVLPLQQSVERLTKAYKRNEGKEPVKPLWIKFDVDNKGKTVSTYVPWKKCTPEEQVACCRQLHDKCASVESNTLQLPCARRLCCKPCKRRCNSDSHLWTAEQSRMTQLDRQLSCQSGADQLAQGHNCLEM